MPRYPFRKLPDLYPEILQRLQQEIAAKTAHEQDVNAAAAAAKTQPETPPSRPSSSEGGQPSTAPSAQNPDGPQPIAKDNKEKPAMPVRSRRPARATPVARAKAALRSKARATPAPRRSLSDIAPGESAFDHHRRKCQVCNHPAREAIEELFIHWHSPRAIRSEFGIHPALDWSSIYRHARAVGLYAKRRKNLRAVFDLLLEQAGNIAPTAHGIVAVVRAYSCLTETNQWVEPEKRVHITNHVYRHDVPSPPPPSPPEEPPASVSAARREDQPPSAPRADSPAFAGSPLATDRCPPPLPNRHKPELDSPPTST